MLGSVGLSTVTPKLTDTKEVFFLLAIAPACNTSSFDDANTTGAFIAVSVK